jgi:hypothetical protein
MVKQANTSKKTDAAAASPMEPGPVTEAGPSVSGNSHDEIARRAYLHWQARGCPHGSAEDDWFSAERELKKAGPDGA